MKQKPYFIITTLETRNRYARFFFKPSNWTVDIFECANRNSLFWKRFKETHIHLTWLDKLLIKLKLKKDPNILRDQLIANLEKIKRKQHGKNT